MLEIKLTMLGNLPVAFGTLIKQGVLPPQPECWLALSLLTFAFLRYPVMKEHLYGTDWVGINCCHWVQASKKLVQVLGPGALTAGEA